MQEQPKLSLALIDDWLDGARSKVNAEQFKFLQLVADRLAVELNLKDPEASLRTAGSEPFAVPVAWPTRHWEISRFEIGGRTLHFGRLQEGD